MFTKNGQRSYVVANISSAPSTVTFSNGTKVTAPAGKTVVTGAITWSGGNASATTGDGSHPDADSHPDPDADPDPDTHPDTDPDAHPDPDTHAHPDADPTPPTPPRRPTARLSRAGTSSAVTASCAPPPPPPARSPGGGELPVRRDAATKASVFTATGVTKTWTGGAAAFDLARRRGQRRSAAPVRSGSPTT